MAALTSDADVVITPLGRDDDRVVQRWLADFLRQHNRRWTAVRGLGWSDAEVDAQLLATDLVSEHWYRLTRSSARPHHLVRIARLGGRPLGGVWAAERVDDYLQVPAGVLNWIYVDPWARGHGVGRLLLGEARRWMRERSLRSMSVSVLADNEPAQRLYASFGLVPADLRLMGSLEET